ncbi:MAG: hypothetical protein HRT71_09590 [Flavobacteriales bacterium]|nr:hypothetical protein [Flavobacteriales bacterium]
MQSSIKIKSLLVLVTCTSLLLTNCSTSTEPSTSISSNTELEKGFLNPASENGALCLWPWMNGYVDTAKLVFELEEMKAKGMRGALIWDVGSLADPDKIIPTGPAFLGKESLTYFKVAMDKGSDLGLDIGLFMSSSWNAGGPWIDSANGSMELITSSQIIEGAGKKKIIIQKPETELGYDDFDNPISVTRYALVSSLAIPYSESKQIDNPSKAIILDQFTAENKVIEWEVPEGKWEVISFFMSSTGQNLRCPSPNSNGLMIDHLSAIATKQHFDSVLTKLATITTPENHLKFLMLDSYEVWTMTDWSPLLVSEFKERYGYDPLPYLPLLKGYKSTDTTIDERFRGDYSRLVSDLMIENHFAQSVTIADQHNIEMVTEAGHGGYPRVDPLKALGNSHIPMGEFWNRMQFWVTKEAASAAHIYNKKLVASESLTGWNHWQHGPADFKQLIDRAFCEGLNQLVFHVFEHNPEIAGKPGFVYHAGEHVNVNATWWSRAEPFMDYIARSSYLLRQGLFVGDACLYYGDQAPNLVPPKKIDPNIKETHGEGLCLHCGAPKPVDVGDLPGYDYDYMNADIITTTLGVKDGKLVLPSGIEYKVMLIPKRVDISLDVIRSLEKLVNDGAIVIGTKPERTTSLKDYPACDDEVKAIADKLWGDADGKTIFSNNYGKGKVYCGKTVQEVLTEINVGKDFSVTGIDNPHDHVDYIHRRTETEDIYFVTNSTHQEQNVTCTFRIKNRVPELWDAVTGLIQRDVAFKKTKNGISIELILEPLSSRFVIFRDQSTGINDADLAIDLQYGTTKLKSTVIDITKDWRVTFDTEMGGPESYQMEILTSWSEAEEIKYYSGDATYSKVFTIETGALKDGTKVSVSFEDIQEIANVTINGNDCGIVWAPPYRLNITDFVKEGANEIIVQVANTWNNRIVGDLSNPDETPYTNTNAKVKFKADGPLLQSGLIGKAEILLSK